jgi:hypothetical protein
VCQSGDQQQGLVVIIGINSDPEVDFAAKTEKNLERHTDLHSASTPSKKDLTRIFGRIPIISIGHHALLNFYWIY